MLSTAEKLPEQVETKKCRDAKSLGCTKKGEAGSLTLCYTEGLEDGDGRWQVAIQPSSQDLVSLS